MSIIQRNFGWAREVPTKERQATIIRFADINTLHSLPFVAGHQAVEHFAIAGYFINELQADTTDLYRFVHIDKDGNMQNLSYGSIRGKKSDVALDAAKSEYGRLLDGALALYTPHLLDLANTSIYRCKPIAVSDKISIIACECDNGTIVGGWLNSQGDEHITSQMLEYCMRAFAILNPNDEVLGARACQIPLEARIYFRVLMLHRGAILRTIIRKALA